MTLTPEERQRIYEEEKARLEDRRDMRGTKHRWRGMVGIAAIVVAASVTTLVFVRPFFVLGEIQHAARSGDAEKLGVLVDFPALREDLKAQINSNLMKRMSPDLEGNPFAALGMAVGAAFVDKAVDAFVSPSGIAALTAGRSPASPPANARETTTATEPQVDYAFESWDRVRAAIRTSGDSSVVVRVTLRRRGFEWRLTKVDIPWPEGIGGAGGTQGFLGSSGSTGQASAVSAPSAPRERKWERLEGRSQMDDSPSLSFSLEAEDDVRGWLAEKRPTLWIRCLEHNTSVFIVTGMAASVEGADDSHTVRIRFDDLPSETQSWTESTNHEALFAPNPIALARKIAKSKRMLARFTPFNASPTTIAFNVSDFGAKIGDLARTCGWSGSIQGGSGSLRSEPLASPEGQSSADNQTERPADNAAEEAPPADEYLPAFGEYVYIDDLPEAITKVPPVYPDAAREAGVDGTVLVQALVGRDGRVKSTRVTHSIAMLDAAAVAAVRQWVFKPALAHDEPKAVWVAIPVKFAPH